MYAYLRRLIYRLLYSGQSGPERYTRARIRKARARVERAYPHYAAMTRGLRLAAPALRSPTITDGKAISCAAR